MSCDAFYSDSRYLDGLEGLKSFRDKVYNRVGLDWSKLSKVQDLALYDYHGKFHPDYAVFEGLRSLDTAYLPKKYGHIDDLPVQGVELLGISNAHLKSFEGFERLKDLKALRLNGCKAFSTGGLAGELLNLRYLNLYSCKSICSLEFIRSMPNLEVLSIERLGEIESWEPLRDHANIRRIEAGPIKGAKMSLDVMETLPQLEFKSGYVTDQI